MTRFAMLFGAGGLLLAATAPAAAQSNEDPAFAGSEDLKIRTVEVTHQPDLDVLTFDIHVEGRAGRTHPQAVGQTDGAPVLGYVFPTTLNPGDVGFGGREGTVALAATHHPDFDDTPLWDENRDADYGNDGGVWHSHWVLLTEDDRVAGGLSVAQFEEGDASVTLPPTAPGMPLYLDSPGFPVAARGDRLRIVVPVSRAGGRTSFRYDGVTAYMEVNASDPERPMLGVYAAYSVASGDLSLPYPVSSK